MNSAPSSRCNLSMRLVTSKRERERGVKMHYFGVPKESDLPFGQLVQKACPGNACRVFSCISQDYGDRAMIQENDPGQLSSETKHATMFNDRTSRLSRYIGKSHTWPKPT